MGKNNLSDTLKRRMSATQQATELQMGEAAYEQLFEGGSSPESAPRPRICELPLDKLMTFFTADIGFKPYPPEKLKAFAQQLAADGLFERIIVRPVPGKGLYEILAGHNRVAAGRLNGWVSIPAEIVEVDDARAVTIATATNLLRRDDLSIIERGKAYKALLEAQSEQGCRTDLRTSGEVRQKFLTREIVAQFFGVTEYEIRKAVKLTCLIPPLAELVDSGSKALPLASAERVAEYDVSSQEAIAEILLIEGNRLNMAAMRHIERRCPPPTADRQEIFAAFREARATEEHRRAAPPKKIAFNRKQFEPYLEKVGGEEGLEKLFLDFLKERTAV